MPVKATASVPSYDWNGLYFGGHVGYSRGSSQVGLGEPDPTSFRKSFGSLSGGIQAGYNRVLPSRLLLGVEANLSVLNALSADELAWFRTTADRPRREDRVDGNAARPRRLRVRPLDDLCDWRVRVVAGTLYSNAGRRRRDRPGPASPHRLVGRCRHGSRARAELDAPAGISLSEFRTGRCRVPVGRDGRIVIRHPHRPRGTELQFGPCA
jgi:hypothetical protein